MDAYTKLLFFLHIGSAIIGIGPTFAFAVLGPMSAVGGQAGGAILEAMVGIERKLVVPIGLVILPVSGVLLIADTGRDANFFRQEWLVAGIAVYIVVVAIALGVNNPALHKIIGMGKEGKAGSPEFMALVKKTKMFGPVMTLLTVAIMFLMIWKPGE